MACFLSMSWTLAILPSDIALDKLIVLGYVLCFIIVSFFRDTKAVIFTGLVSFFGYIILFFCPFLEVGLTPISDIFSIFIGLAIVGFITQDSKQRYLELLDARERFENSKKVLEVRVKARTKELGLLTKEREKTIEVRTKDLNEKVKELTMFNKLTVGRELKMIALKKEIEDLRKSLKG